MVLKHEVDPTNKIWNNLKYLENKGGDTKDLALQDGAEGEDDSETKSQGHCDDDHVVHRPRQIWKVGEGWAILVCYQDLWKVTQMPIEKNLKVTLWPNKNS